MPRNTYDAAYDLDVAEVMHLPMGQAVCLLSNLELNARHAMFWQLLAKPRVVAGPHACSLGGPPEHCFDNNSVMRQDKERRQRVVHTYSMGNDCCSNVCIRC